MTTIENTITCPLCGGTGQTTHTCPECRGTGCVRNIFAELRNGHYETAEESAEAEGTTVDEERASVERAIAALAPCTKNDPERDGSCGCAACIIEMSIYGDRTRFFT